MGVFSNGGASKTVKASGVTQEPEETETDRPRNTVRLKNETKEEKKQRKQEVKTDRKASSSMFKIGQVMAGFGLAPYLWESTAIV